jgi:hypothetical protein
LAPIPNQQIKNNSILKKVKKFKQEGDYSIRASFDGRE